VSTVFDADCEEPDAAFQADSDSDSDADADGGDAVFQR
jgi:hypothetical protein